MFQPRTYNMHLQPSEPATQKSCCEKTSEKLKNTYQNIKVFAKEKPFIFGLICFGILAVIIIIIAVPVALSKKNKEEAQDVCSNIYSDECLYEKMIAKKQEFPEGMPWTNDNYYAWKGGIYSGGHGCAGFSFMLSDVCFGDIQANLLEQCPSKYKVGDVVRINNDTHFIIILKIDLNTNTITIAEGNYNSSIHWGRTFTIQGLTNICNYVLRRNPN